MVKKAPKGTIAAGEFKAKCLRIMDEVAATRRPVTVTKKGRPIAKLVPIEGEETTVFGCLQDEITVVGDILAPVVPATDWKALR
jgi:prevent-host-death family protein